MSKSLYRKGDKIGDGNYSVRRKIGEGQFSEVYEVEKISDGRSYALKIEKSRDVKTVRKELSVLQTLQQCRQVCSLRHHGSEDGRAFFVMQLLGANLVQMVRKDYGGRVPLDAAKVLAASLLNALEGLHREGFVHRDVKPANFALDRPSADPVAGAWMLIDFGLARRFRDAAGAVLPERQDAGFRGSTTYASVNAHEGKDLGRRDDLWSWFYTVVEMIEGTLPWRAERPAGGEAAAVPSGKQAVGETKRECVAHPERLFSAVPLPPALREVNRYLAGLNFGDEPNYSFIRSLLAKLDGIPAVDGAAVAAAMAAPPPDPVPVPAAPQPEAAAAAPAPNNNASNGDLRVEAAERKAQRTRSRPQSRSPERRSRSPGRRGSGRRSSRSRSRSRRRNRRSRSRSRSRRRDRSRSRSRSRTRTPPKKADVKEAVVADAQTKFQNTMEFVGMLRSGGVSREGAAAVRQLRQLQPTEAIGIACLLIDELAAGTQGQQAALLARLLEDVAGFSQVTAARCTASAPNANAAAQ